ncbi:glycosyltransferase [Arundinibacter roseus]|uniref:Glycosyltransferase family 1 protein n=1 Tax=Arundinibacter roseus TaxID=2070510 RepID=A0A4R4K750_9BACT|nr:glycosyltransferase [Arundinibacter roseus]TDB63377.1 glycosyltransferase family 1 protein [Arundinibacter roseus]
MKRIKVLHIVTGINGGGVGKLLLDYTKGIDNNLFQIDFMPIENNIDKQFLHDDLIKLGCEIVYMPKNYLFRFLFIFKFLWNNKYDIVHSHIELPSCIYLFISKLCGVKIRIAHAHMAFLLYDNFVHKIMRIVLNLVCTDRWGCSQDALLCLFGNKFAHYGFVLKNAINYEEFIFQSNVREKMRRKLNVSSNFVVGSVARFTYQKFPEFLIYTFADIVKLQPDAILILVGSGELEQKIKELVSELGLDKYVLFLGLRKDISNLMQAFDVFVMPSRYEGLGIVLVEAQASSLPSFTSNKVPKEVLFSDFIYSLPLEIGCSKWAEFILEKYPCHSRYNASDWIIKNGYDLPSIVNSMSYRYSSNLKIIYKH